MQQIISLTRKGKTPESVCVCVWGGGENAREKYIYEIMHNLFYFVYKLKSVNFFAATFHKNIWNAHKKLFMPSAWLLLQAPFGAGA